MENVAKQAYEAFEHVVGAGGEFLPRPGQNAMAKLVAKTLSKGTLGKSGDGDQGVARDRAIAIIEAGTGIGKSVAAAVPAISAAVQRDTRVIISTATVNLQEQLLQKDLPRIAELLDQPFTVAIGKGRGRYVCKLKLEHQVAGGGDDMLDLFGSADDGTQAQEKTTPSALPEATMVLYRDLANDLASGHWDGERDSLQVGDEQVQWGRIAADRTSCTGKHCPRRSECTYFEARKKVAAANVIVVNHDLLLSSIGANLLPDTSDCLLVLDEAHELPAVASAHFGTTMDLSSLRWLEQLGIRISKVGAVVGHDGTKDAVKLAGDLRQALADLMSIVMGLYTSYVNSKQKTVRLQHGKLPEGLVEPMAFIRATAKGLSAHLAEMAEKLREQLDAGAAPEVTAMYSALGALAPRVGDVAACADLMLRESDGEDAKWFEFTDDKGFVRVTANANPINPGDLLASELWPNVRSAILTSATLQSCGNFKFFLSEVGLEGDSAVTTLAVPSPFDYQTQGSLIVVETESSPSQIADYNQEVSMELVHDFATVARGALALFTSKAHLEQVWKACPPTMQDLLRVQGTASRASLLAEHRARVDAGQPSIILGLQSFGQGVDLPGHYCETLFIAKLPFAPPTDPVSEAREEWLRSRGGNAFEELSVPATGVRLAQWVGRLIRSESDRGEVVCYDKRLVQTRYGKRILAGLPPFAVRLRHAGTEAPMTSAT